MPTDTPTHSASSSFLAPIASQVAFPPVSCWCSCWKNSPMPSAVVMIPYIPRFVCQILHLITLSFCDAGVIITDCTAERWDVSGVIEASVGSLLVLYTGCVGFFCRKGQWEDVSNRRHDAFWVVTFYYGGLGVWLDDSTAVIFHSE